LIAKFAVDEILGMSHSTILPSKEEVENYRRAVNILIVTVIVTVTVTVTITVTVGVTVGVE
jgi:MFS superfamily sulfate permease-like transporter